MPWVNKFNQYAYAKMKEYNSLEISLIDKRKKISDNLVVVRNCKIFLINKVNNMGGLSGEYLIKYENKRDEYMVNYTKINKSFNDFLRDLNLAISQCNSKKLEWDSKVYTWEWEEPEEVEYVRN